MKKIISLFVAMQFIILPAFSLEDTFVNQTLASYKDVTYESKLNNIDDFLITETFIAKNKNKIINSNKNLIVDNLAVKISASENLKYVVPNLSYDYSKEDKTIDLNIKSKKYVTTKGDLAEGDLLYFYTVEDIKLKNGNILPKGTEVVGVIETVSQNKAFGVPADLIVDRFKIKNKNIKLLGTINKTGANRSLWVYPLVYTTSCFFGVGLLFIPIRGGHAKLKLNDVYTIGILE